MGQPAGIPSMAELCRETGATQGIARAHGPFCTCLIVRSNASGEVLGSRKATQYWRNMFFNGSMVGTKARVIDLLDSQLPIRFKDSGEVFAIPTRWEEFHSRNRQQRPSTGKVKRPSGKERDLALKGKTRGKFLLDMFWYIPSVTRCTGEHHCDYY